MKECNINIPSEDVKELVDKYAPEGREVHEAILVVLSHKPGEPEEEQVISAVSGYMSNNEIRRVMLDTAKEALA